MIDKRQLYVGKVDSESLGLKHYLGHTKNLPKADSGLAISKSSLALNKLQDKIGEVSKIRRKIEELKVSKVREEIVMMLCPHIGKGQRDLTNLKKFLDDLKAREELEKLQEQDQLEESEDQQSQLQNQQINQGENQNKDNSQFLYKNSSNSQYNKKEVDDQILSQDEQITQNMSRLNTLQQLQQQKMGSKKDQNEKKVRVQVATDKNEFLSENQKKLKQDKEQKAKLMQDQKKYFLEEHQDLAKSVFGIKQRDSGFTSYNSIQNQ
ncbi:hypothetical protein PPERSA_10669 [Pseudocohnilembus persalinus]|uniref:Uncharacterized protein n=1 Tax=Pseudocohnilembus persalinus TaxID=266149 RepID=A0A0V0QDA4_PSEPJ|nr:hypothetical protein PPERSA_10669 [Pseudocohnilembus persalinus]|eukprot:KRX00170.1 hypothetical protein PPERSA_10669 [Pseudocohnilembus persalinus]